MTPPRPVIARRRAEQDIQDAVAHYLEQAGGRVALKFIDALERAYAQIARQPGAGSPRYAHELDLPGLRFRIIPGFPYLVFYVQRDAGIDVWRALHAQRDIPSWLGEDDAG